MPEGRLEPLWSLAQITNRSKADKSTLLNASKTLANFINDYAGWWSGSFRIVSGPLYYRLSMVPSNQLNRVRMHSQARAEPRTIVAGTPDSHKLLAYSIQGGAEYLGSNQQMNQWSELCPIDSGFLGRCTQFES